jgi:hypothetical protein
MTYYVEALGKRNEPQPSVRRIGEFETVPDAIAAAQRLIDAFLRQVYKPGVDAKALFALYQSKGEHPYIFRDDGNTFNVPGFNHTQYAMTRAGEICKQKS